LFTGLIREIAVVKSFQNNTLSIKSNHKAKLGDSIAINGACLSVTKLTNDGFEVQLSPESQKVLAIQNYKNKVHIEPAMMMGDRFEGHIVQGHIDCIGEIIDIKNNGNSYDFFIKIPKKQIIYMVPKGSVTIDGVSLTLNEVFDESFRLTIIPITMRETLFGTYKKGSKVNIESDMFARYTAHIINHQNKSNSIGWGEIDAIQSLF